MSTSVIYLQYIYFRLQRIEQKPDYSALFFIMFQEKRQLYMYIYLMP